MAHNPAAQTAFGPMVQVAIEQYEPRHRRLVEDDLAVNITRKLAAVEQAIGALPPSVHLVPLDFENGDLIGALTEHGCRQDMRTFFIWEGGTQYLTEDAVRATLEALRAARSGSRLAFTYVRRDFIDGKNMYGAAMLYRRFRQRAQLWRFGLNPDEVSTFVAPYGWQLMEQAGPDYFLRHYVEPTGRDLTTSQLEWSAYAQKV